MATYHWEDPHLKPYGERLLIFGRDLLRDPYMTRLYHPNKLDNLSYHPLAVVLRLKDQLSVYRRKYRGEFYWSDFFDSNKLRLLFFNFGELIGLKSGPVGPELKSFSRNLLRGGLSGYALNGAYYMGTYGYAAQQAGKSELKYLNFMGNLISAAIILSPLQYLAMVNLNFYNNRSVSGSNLLANVKNTSNNFIGLALCSVLFTSVYGTSLYLHNTDNLIMNYLYYPVMASSYFFLTAAANVLKVSDNKKSVEQTIKSMGTRQFAGFAAFVALNSILPIKIDQLRSKEYFANAHLDFVRSHDELHRADRPYE